MSSDSFRAVTNKLKREEVCANCEKTKDEHADNRWCYNTSNSCASSADWSEFAVDKEVAQ